MKIGRNDPCPCGSQRKHKHCCLAHSGADVASANVQFRRGMALHARAALPEAAAAYQQAVTLHPGYAEAYVNLGNVLRDLGQADAAVRAIGRALELRPDFVELYLNLGGLLQGLGRHAEAIAGYKRALAARPADHRLHHNLGEALQAALRFEDAEASFRAALALDGALAMTRYGLGNALYAQQRHGEAAGQFRAASALDPANADPLIGLGDALLGQGRWRDAHAAYREALALAPATPARWSVLLLASLYSDCLTAAQIRRDHLRYADRFESPLRERSAAAQCLRPAPCLPDPARRLRIGYVSPDLRAHSVAYFVEPVLAGHDRAAFEVSCYDTADVADAVTRRCRGHVEHWVPVAHLDDEELAARIRADGIDILVDLSGHTRGNRLLVFARRPAPVQVSWVGYPASTGLRHIDYFLTDAVAGAGQGGAAVAAPDHAEAQYLLPGVFSVYRPPAFAPDVGTASDPGATQLVLGSFNNADKISDAVVALWARLLAQLPGARLLLKDRRFGHDEFRAGFLDRFAEQGVAPTRLELLPRSATDVEHLALYARVDIALDTFPYCGVTTTCEALWMGVPVVSLVGDRHLSRTGLTLLRAIGQPQWAAADEAGYVQAVVDLAGDAPRRLALRQGLREQMRRSPLMDEAKFTRQLEAAYRDMWQRAAAGCDTLPASPT